MEHRGGPYHRRQGRKGVPSVVREQRNGQEGGAYLKLSVSKWDWRVVKQVREMEDFGSVREGKYQARREEFLSGHHSRERIKRGVRDEVKGQ
jgi:hypothetical protein